MRYIWSPALPFDPHATLRTPHLELRSMTIGIVKVYRKTETLRPSGFIAKIEIFCPSGITQRSDPKIFDTKEQAQARENEMAQEWKVESAPADV
jgi:hypothetical protein